MAWLEILSNVFIFASQNLPLFFFVTLIACALWGDASLIFLVAFSMNSNIPLTLTFAGAYIGAMLGDLAWFFLGTALLNKIKNSKFEKRYKNLELIIERFAGKSILLMLSIAKILAGTRVISTIYLAKKKISLSKFLYYDALALIIWTTIIGSIGYLVGWGFAQILYAVEGIKWALAFLVIFFILFSLFQREINYLIKKIQ